MARRIKRAAKRRIIARKRARRERKVSGRVKLATFRE